MKKTMAMAGLALALLVTGCATFQANAGKTLSSVAITVDAAMKGWAAYVVAGGATPDQETQVRAAYHKYQLSMSAAQSAYAALVATGDQPAWTQAASILTATQQQLVGLINSFQTMPTKASTIGGK